MTHWWCAVGIAYLVSIVRELSGKLFMHERLSYTKGYVCLCRTAMRFYFVWVRQPEKSHPHIPVMPKIGRLEQLRLRGLLGKFSDGLLGKFSDGLVPL